MAEDEHIPISFQPDCWTEKPPQFTSLSQDKVWRYLCRETDSFRKVNRGWAFKEEGYVLNVRWNASDDSQICLVRAICLSSMKKAPYTVSAWFASGIGRIMGGSCSGVAWLSETCHHIAALLLTAEESCNASGTSCTDIPRILGGASSSQEACSSAATCRHHILQVFGQPASEGEEETLQNPCEAVGDASSEQIQALRDGLRIRTPGLQWLEFRGAEEARPARPPLPIADNEDLWSRNARDGVYKPAESLPPLTDEEWAEVTRSTIGQADNPRWHEERRGRITASVLSAVIKCMKPEYLVKGILYPSQDSASEAMRYGRMHEGTAVAAYEFFPYRGPSRKKPTERNLAITSLTIERLQAKRTVSRAELLRLSEEVSALLTTEDLEPNQEDRIVEIRDELDALAKEIKQQDALIEPHVRDDAIAGEYGGVRKHQCSSHEPGHDLSACNARTRPLKEPITQKFSGDRLGLQPFWEQFRLAVHENSALSDTEKFLYLCAALVVKAAAAVSGIQGTEQNYKYAVKTLKERFGRQDVLVQEHLTQLLSLQHVKSLDDVSALRRLHDPVQRNIAGLTTLGVPPDSYSAMLCAALFRVLPTKWAIYTTRQCELRMALYEGAPDLPPTPRSPPQSDSPPHSPPPPQCRYGNTEWCSCNNCGILENGTEGECICCREMGTVLTRVQPAGCITEHPEFSMLCLNISVLRLLYFELRGLGYPMHNDIHSIWMVAEESKEHAHFVLHCEAKRHQSGETKRYYYCHSSRSFQSKSKGRGHWRSSWRRRPYRRGPGEPRNEASELMEDVGSLEDSLAAIAPTIKRTEAAINAGSHREARFNFNVVASCTARWTSSGKVVPESTKLWGASAGAAIQQLEAEVAQRAAEETPPLVMGEGSRGGLKRGFDDVQAEEEEDGDEEGGPPAAKSRGPQDLEEVLELLKLAPEQPLEEGATNWRKVLEQLDQEEINPHNLQTLVKLVEFRGFNAGKLATKIMTSTCSGYFKKPGTENNSKTMDVKAMVVIGMSRGSKVEKIHKGLPAEGLKAVNMLIDTYGIVRTTRDLMVPTFPRMVAVFPSVAMDFASLMTLGPVSHMTMTSSVPNYPRCLMCAGFPSLILTRDQDFAEVLISAYLLYQLEVSLVLNPDFKKLSHDEKKRVVEGFARAAMQSSYCSEE
ncbi:hypothetical protein HPB47_014425 [Ixodes persulcatus]|uniref:Uncharacterized protein n=1 Tax=Ixodes persulcatus TaxID=34615 RepID=A0AC60QXW8_IXOPE|nr:hypothetical protein HPB47_014425 [Ixodes persulcatus]